MAQVFWKNTGSGNWSTASLWFSGVVPGTGDDVVFNAGSFDAVINGGETFAIRSLTQNGSATRLGGVISITDFSAVGAGGIIYGGSVGSGQGKITNAGTGGVLRNDGQIIANVGGGTLQIDTASFTNQGTVSATGGALLFISADTLTNLAGGTLTGGSYVAAGDDGSHGSAIEVVGGFVSLVNGVPTFGDGRVIVNNATISLGLNGGYLGWNQSSGTYDTVETSLSSIGAAGQLNILGARNYVTGNTLANAGVLSLGQGTLQAGGLTNNGVLSLAGGVFNSASLTNGSSGFIVGFGTIVPAVGNIGLIEAHGGTLLLAGGVTNGGLLQVDALATLEFQGLSGQAIVNNGTIAVPAGTLRLTGAISGGGGYFIEGGSSGAVTTLDLATAAAGDVAFNGANGMLVLDSPAGFTGSIIGFGTGDTIDLAGIVSNGATLVGNTLNITNGGSTVYALHLAGDYSTASFAGASDGVGGTRITLTGVEPRDFTLEAAHWADKTISWSLATFQYAADSAIPFSSSIDPSSQAAFVAVIQQALDTWASIGGFSFVQQADSSDATQAADLRFGWGSLLGTGGEIGQASFTYSGTTFLPDLVVRLQDPAITPLVADAGVIGGLRYQGLTSTFYQIVVHEIGHALGLGHSTNSGAVMYPSALGTQNQSPSASDIAGIHAIYDTIPCFAAGTQILTARGAVLVEELMAGDRVATVLSGRLRRVRWIGHRTVAPLRHARPEDVMPIRVAAGAFGPGRPLRDLLLSPDHAVFVGGGAPGDAKVSAPGALIPIRHLVNGATIRPMPMARVTYFHVELAHEDGTPAHDVLLAEGLPAESFLDTGNRDAFADAPVPALHPDFARRVWDAAACAPLHEGGALVASLRERLLGIAMGLGHERTADPGLHAVARGRVIAPVRIGEAWRFDLPAGMIELRSRSEVPAEFSGKSTERRRLGVALAALCLDGRPIALGDARFRGGVHQVEHSGPASWRWTNGAAVLVLDAPGRLDMMLGTALEYWRESQGTAESYPTRKMLTH